MPEPLESVLSAARDLGLDLAEPEPLGVTAWNAHYRVALAGAPHHLVVYRLPDAAATAGLELEHRLLRGLAERGFRRAPRLVVAPDGRSLLPCPGGWFAVTEWVAGCRREDDPPPTPGQVEAMAAGLAELHEAMAGLDLTLAYHPDHVFVYPFADFAARRDALVARLEERLAGPGFDDAARAAWADARRRVLAAVAGVPAELYARVAARRGRGLVHGDFRALNAAFAGDALTAILDFNCCFEELRPWDLAYTALGLAGKETIGPLADLEPAARFLRAYDRAAPLDADERRLLARFLPYVPAKLMVGAVEPWWITDRAPLLAALADGAAGELLARAGLTPEEDAS